MEARQALFKKLVDECRAEVVAIFERMGMEERVRNDPKKLNEWVEKLVRRAMSAPPNGPEPTEQDIRRSIKSSLETMKRNFHNSQIQRRAAEMIEALGDFKMMLNATVRPSDRDILSNAVKRLEEFPRDASGKPRIEDQKTMELVSTMYTQIYAKVKSWKEGQISGQQMDPGAVPMAPPKGPHPQAMQASAMPPMAVNQPVPMQPPPPPSHQPAKPMHGGGYQQPVHPQEHQVRKADVPPPQSCDELLTKLFRNVRNDTAVFYSTPHPPHI